MLQRAASNAYSWWWASHIRTKQSKWLDESLQDTEEKVKSMLKFIEEDADSFAKRAEMYFRRRPELIGLVQELYNSYRGLAERYDRVSGELHKANNTIATIFPDQVHFETEDEGDDDDDESPPKATSIDFSRFHKALPPNLQFTLYKDIISSSSQKKPKMKRTGTQMSKDKAQEEIDKLQKGILVLQTEKEFIKSSYLNGLAKYWDIEKTTIEMQEKVCGLQDEFSAETVIEDDEARALMAVTALKSCEESLVSLHEQQNKSREEARVASQRIKNASEKLRALKKEAQVSYEESYDPNLANGKLKGEACSLKEERIDSKSVCEKIKRNFEMNTENSILEFADKIDELGSKVIAMEMELSSQEAQIQSLRMETDEVQKKLQILEEEKMNLVDDSKGMSDKLRQAEEELLRIRDLDRHIHDESSVIQTHFTEICHSFYDLSCELQDEVEIHKCELKRECKEKSQEHNDILATEKPEEFQQEEKSKRTDLLQEQQQSLGSGSQQRESEEHEDFPLQNWEQFLLNGLEEREKILLSEYTSILRNYKETKRKLAEVEKKNQDYLFEKMAQIGDLKNTILMKDEEIQSLKQKLNFLESSWNENPEIDMEEPEVSVLSELRELPTTGNAEGSSLSTLFAKSFSMLKGQNLEPVAVNGTESSEAAATESTPAEGMELHQIDESRTMTATEEKFRRDIDKLLEENLEFWLRFTSSFELIQKFQKTIQDLQTEIQKLKDNKKTDSNNNSTNTTGEKSVKQEATSTHKQLTDLQADISVWIEQNAVLKQELQGRFSSLCNIKEEISKASSESKDEGGEDQLSAYQAARFNGEILNMQQENNTVADELGTGLDYVKELQEKVTKALANLGNNSEPPASKGRHYHHFRNFSKTKLPLRSFLFGGKPLKPPTLPCMKPALQKQHSDMGAELPA